MVEEEAEVGSDLLSRIGLLNSRMDMVATMDTVVGRAVGREAFNGYPVAGEHNARCLAKRPRDWRPDYSVKPGIISLRCAATGRWRSDVPGEYFLFSFFSFLW
jgi:hypothetical protein